jgi:molybdopterin converting factor small subunit
MRETVKVYIRYFSTVREKLDRRLDEIILPKGSTFQSISDWLQQNRDLTVTDLDFMPVVNSRCEWNLSNEIQEGDTISLFPLLSGG